MLIIFWLHIIVKTCQGFFGSKICRANISTANVCNWKLKLLSRRGRGSAVTAIAPKLNQNYKLVLETHWSSGEEKNEIPFSKIQIIFPTVINAVAIIIIFISWLSCQMNFDEMFSYIWVVLSEGPLCDR